MKKLYILMVFLTALGWRSSLAQSINIWESYAILNINGGGNTFYDMQASTANPDFQGAALGTFTSSNSLVIKGGQNKINKCNGGNVTGGNLYWRVYKTGTTPPATFNSVTYVFVSNDGGTCNGDQTWQGTGGTTNVLAGLISAGNYTLEVYSDAPGTPSTAYSNNGGNNYKATFTYYGNSTWPVTVTATNGEPLAYYQTLRLAFQEVNSGFHKGDITATISGNTAEGASANVLFGSGSASSPNSNYTSLLVTTTGNFTVSGTSNTMIDLKGADNVTFDGSINGLTIAGAGTSYVVRLVDDATNNTFIGVSFVTSTVASPIGGATPSNSGAVVISNGLTTGNDNNSFTNCKFRPASGVSSPVLFYAFNNIGAAENNNITINNCEFYDYFKDGSEQAAIWINDGNSGFTITNNKIYQTATRNVTTSNNVYGIYFVNINSTLTNTINNNTIGYASASGTGTMTYNAAATDGSFNGIYFSFSQSTANASSVSGNTISNISWTSTGASNFFGIYNLNTTTGTAPLSINNNTVSNISTVNTTGSNYYIISGSGNITCNNNNINNNSRSGAGDLIALNLTSANTITCTGNTVSAISSTGAASGGNFYGYYSGKATTENASNNSFTNFTSASTGTSVVQNMYGMMLNSSVSTNKTVQGNTVSNLSQSNSGGTVTGIRNAYGTTDILQNVVHTLSGAQRVQGIHNSAAGTVANISRNKVYGLTSAHASAAVAGITAQSGTTTDIYNNFVSGLSAPSANNSIAVYGLNLQVSTVNASYNTVYIGSGGSLTSSGSLFGGAGMNVAAGVTVTSKNNIINVNATAKGDAYFAAFKREGAGTTTASNNIYYCAPAPYVYGVGNTLSTATNVYYVAASGYTGTADPNFNLQCGLYKTYLPEAKTFWENNLVAGTEANTFVPSGSSYAEANATTSTTPSITVDYAGTTRAATPDVGALEFSGTAISQTVAAALTTNATTNLVAFPCDDANGWTYYQVSGDNSKYYFGIQWGTGNNLAKNGATVAITLLSAPTAQTSGANSRFAMRRYWNVTLPTGTSLTSPVKVRFFYDQAEQDEVRNMATDYLSNPAATGAVRQRPLWFKTTSGDYDGSQVTSTGVTGAVPLDSTYGTINGITYVESTVNSFSGGTYLTGTALNSGSVLPVSLVKLSAQRVGAVNEISWTTATEVNNSGFEVERSTDGNQFSKVGYVASKANGGNSSALIQYNYSDNNFTGNVQYYRLRQVDRDGKFVYSNVVAVKASAGGKFVVNKIYPVPTNTILKLDVNAVAETNTTLLVTDILGRVVLTQSVNVKVGANVLSVNVGGLMTGQYFIKMKTMNDEIIPMRFTKM